VNLSNIWNHPKTSVAGVLLAVITVAGVLSGQGITLGNLGTGTVVTLIASLGTALLGLLAKDPGSASPATGGTVKLGVLMLVALLIELPFASGCTGASVAQNIVNWTPTLQSAVASVDATASVLDPAAAPIFAAATVGFDAASNVLVAQARAYLANPSATVLQQLQTAVVTFQQQVNASLLSAAHITNPASQQKAMADLNGVATIINTILSLVVSISSKAAVAQMAAESPVKLASVQAYIDQEQLRRVLEKRYGYSPVVAAQMASAGTAQLEGAGF
jgi:hypothetical protein